MRFRGILSAIMVISLILIASCVEKQAPPPAIKKVDDPCMRIRCLDNEFCVKGECLCKPGTSICGEVCIRDDQCCTENDCGNGEFCENNGCTSNCKDVNCTDDKVCDKYTGECVCALTHKWCVLQDKCIPKDNCCSNADCMFDEVCLRTRLSSHLCFEEEGQRSCKSFGEGKTNFFFGETRYPIDIKKITEQKVELTFDISKDIVLQKGENTKILDGPMIKLEEIRQIGGMCESDI